MASYPAGDGIERDHKTGDVVTFPDCIATDCMIGNLHIAAGDYTLEDFDPDAPGCDGPGWWVTFNLRKPNAENGVDSLTTVIPVTPAEIQHAFAQPGADAGWENEP